MQIDFKNINLKNIDLKDPKIQNAVLIALLGLIVFVLYLYFMLLPQIASDARIAGKTMKMRSDLKAARSLIAQKAQLLKKAGEYN